MFIIHKVCKQTVIHTAPAKADYADVDGVRGFWYPWGSQNKPLMDTKGQLYIIIYVKLWKEGNVGNDLSRVRS